MDIIDVSREPIDVAAVLSRMADPSAGGTACFVGTTRDTFQERRVLQLEYESYESMALRELSRVVEAMRQKWTLKSVALVHRLGVVPVSEASVLVAASSVHRKNALEAVAFAIERIKSSVPIWKKEQYDDGSYSWKANVVPAN